MTFQLSRLIISGDIWRHLSKPWTLTKTELPEMRILKDQQLPLRSSWFENRPH